MATHMYAPRTLLPILFFSACTLAQNAARPQFEVASIKPSAADFHGMGIRALPGGRVNISNLTLKRLITFAWRVQSFQVSGGPPWIDSLHYDVSAKAEKSFGQDEMPLMLQSLLEDRFQLKLRHETKELPVFALVMAKKDGKPGPGLVPSKEGNCTAFDPTKPPPAPQPGKLPPMGCGGIMRSPKGLTATSIPLARFVQVLSDIVERTVVDHTGLTGNFDISLEWTPDDAQAMRLPPGATPPPPSDASGPSIFTALQEQLGLKVESQKGPVDILIVDHAEKPSEN